MTGRTEKVEGRHVAAVVPVAVGESAAVIGAAADDGDTAVPYATNMAIIEHQGGIPGRTMAEVTEEYATDLLGEFGGSAERALAAGRGRRCGHA